MKCKISIVLLIVLAHAQITTTCKASSTEAKIIDRHGKRILSIFSGITPDPRIALECSRIINDKRQNPGSGTVRKTIYRRADRPRLLPVCNAPCRSHYQVQYTRDCLSCGGGTENWCYSDSINATYCEGYAIYPTGCVSGCTEEDLCGYDPTLYNCP
jgi:hypothetical protein